MRPAIALVLALLASACVAMGPPAVPGTVLRDVPAAPELVVLAGGEVTLGAPADEADRQPNDLMPHTVRLAPFAMMRTEVTWTLYNACVAAEACQPVTPEDPSFAVDERLPVVGITHRQANDYARWITEVTGRRHRLPTEAEFEYALRAGTRTPYWTGERITTRQANFDGVYGRPAARREVFRARPVRPGTHPANPWGIYDLAGNVWEWTSDCWHEGPEPPGRRLAVTGCDRKAQRGGSWNGVMWTLRSAYRVAQAVDEADDMTGFRLVAETRRRER
jgi:formylglycine-generating enzyme required for sulfatase activity